MSTGTVVKAWVLHIIECVRTGYTPRGDHVAHALHDLHERVEKLEECARKVCPVIVNCEIAIKARGKKMTLTAVAIWSDGFRGFDDNHVKPDDWAPIFTEASGDAALTDNGDGTATVTPGTTDSDIDLSAGGFASNVVIAAAAPPAPTIVGVDIDES